MRLSIGLGVFIVYTVSLWVVFKKAGKPGWGALIPVYNLVLLVQIVKYPIWTIIFFFIPIANLVMGICIFASLGKKFGQSTLFCVGLAVLSIIFLPVLALKIDKVQYDAGAEGV